MFEAPRQIKSAILGPGDVALGPAPPSQIDVRGVLTLLWRGRTTILRTTALSLLAAFLFIILVPHRYTAVTQILIDPTDLHAVGSDLTPPNQMSDAAVLQVESQVRVLTSDSVLRRVIATEGLDRDPEFAGPASPLRAVLAVIGVGSYSGSDSTLAALTAFKRNVTVKRAERTYVVDVSVSSRVPEKAARIANAVAQAYLAEQTDVRSNAARQVSHSLSARLTELQDHVRQAEERVEAFKARNNIVGASGMLVNEQQLTELNNQLGAARARTAQAKARLDQVESVQKSKVEVGAFPEAVQSQTITALRTQYAEVMRREAEQMTSLGDRHPAVIEIQAQAERLRRMIEEEVNRIALSARSEYESARANEETLTRNLETLKHNTIATNEAMVTLRELERDVQASRAVYEAFLVRARETGEQERLDTKNIRVISRADLPLHRSFPPSNLVIAVGALIFGIAAGAGIVIARPPDGELTTRARTGGAVRDPQKIAKLVSPAPATAAIPVLATLPRLDAAFAVEAATEPVSPVAKEIRKVYDAVWANHSRRGSPCILVTACGEEDDTAAVALGLATVAAATHRVLLIDADLEQRTLSAVDAERSDAGLVDVALGRRFLSDVVVRDAETKINFLPFVCPDSRRDRQIKDEDIKEAFAQTKSFEVVIVSAMDCEHDPSAGFFAGLVDHIVLACKSASADEGAIAETVSLLGLDARKIRGVVLTGAQADWPLA